MSKNGEQVIQAIRETVAENRYHVHNGACKFVDYTHNGNYVPSCLVGHGLWKAGLIDETFFYEPANKNSISKIGEKLFGFTPKEVDWLLEVQMVQDCKRPWSEAVESADIEYPLPVKELANA
jgi:hypothetical protein